MTGKRKSQAVQLKETHTYLMFYSHKTQLKINGCLLAFKAAEVRTDYSQKRDVEVDILLEVVGQCETFEIDADSEEEEGVKLTRTATSILASGFLNSH